MEGRKSRETPQQYQIRTFSLCTQYSGRCMRGEQENAAALQARMEHLHSARRLHRPGRMTGPFGPGEAKAAGCVSLQTWTSRSFISSRRRRGFERRCAMMMMMNVAGRKRRAGSSRRERLATLKRHRAAVPGAGREPRAGLVE